MKYFTRLAIVILTLIGLTACSGGVPQLFWSVDDNKPDYAKGPNGGASAQSRMPLEVPPELRDAEVPEPDRIATGNSADLPAEEKKLVAGTAVALDARIYPRKPSEVFSAVVDAMTSLNLPVGSVDSPSGTVTTDWISKGSTSNQFILNGLFGSGNAVAVRYRYVVRVLRQKTEAGKEVARLEIRTIGQAFENRQWVNKPIRRKLADELFAATEERLGSM